MAQLNVRVPDELLERLKAEAKRRDLPAARIVRDAIEAKLPSPPKEPDPDRIYTAQEREQFDPRFAWERVPGDVEKAGYRQVHVPDPGGTAGLKVEVGNVTRPPPNALQLSTRTGMPKVICQRMIDGGRVSVGADGRWLLDGNSV